MPPQHQNLASGRWLQLSLMEQLANVGSEVGRAAKWQGKDQENFQYAYRRALELLDLTIGDHRWRGRLKEIVRAREFFCAAALDGNEYKTTLADLERYFSQFALAVRLRK